MEVATIEQLTKSMNEKLPKDGFNRVSGAFMKYCVYGKEIVYDEFETDAEIKYFIALIVSHRMEEITQQLNHIKDLGYEKFISKIFVKNIMDKIIRR